MLQCRIMKEKRREPLHVSVHVRVSTGFRTDVLHCLEINEKKAWGSQKVHACQFSCSLVDAHVHQKILISTDY